MNDLPKGFDHAFYSNHNPDLFSYADNKELLENHYLYVGRFENRKYCSTPDNFNWKKYILLNRNVFDTVDKCTKDNAIYHFLNNDNNGNHANYIDDVNDVNASANDKPIYILYYAYLYNGQKWKNIITGQITDLCNSGILKMGVLHAVLLGTPHEIKEAKSLIENIINDTIEITEVYENLYEFPALMKIRELALLHPDKLFIYFHSKSMINWNPSQDRTLLEYTLTNQTFLNWDSTLFIFDNFPEIQKAGCYPAKEGWIWYNFWWARGSYLISCSPIEIPINMVENDRFICECWIGKNGSNTWTDLYSFATKNISHSNNPGEISLLVDDMKKFIKVYDMKWSSSLKLPARTTRLRIN
jgi:hypothetical protein